jgi:hypothetical protein
LVRDWRSNESVDTAAIILGESMQRKQIQIKQRVPLRLWPTREGLMLI